MSRVAVAMSGGVDSSVAAALLAEQGRDVVGITLQLWDYSELNLGAGQGRCCSPADIADARRVAARLGIPHYVFDHGDAFRRDVVEPFLQSWADGCTPSPCITCNRRVKFDLLWRLARGLGADRLATGHYARLQCVDGEFRLRKGIDPDKDQSYFLFDVPQERLEGVCFPLGALSKEGTRAVARRHGLPVADKPESYELCFIPDGDKDAFVEDRVDTPSGEIRHVDGRRLGGHDGVHRFTVGQRRGLGVEAGERLYVVDIGADGTVTVGDEAELYADGLRATRCNWLASPPTGAFRAAARIRHRHPEVACTVEPIPEGGIGVRFDEPQRAVAPGQGVALYDGDRLLGGGWIDAPLDGGAGSRLTAVGKAGRKRP